MPSIIDRFFRRTRPTTTRGATEIPNNPAGGEFMDSVRSSIRKSIDRFSVAANSLVVGGPGYNHGSNPFGASGVLVGNSDADPSFSGTDLGQALPVDTNKVSRIDSYERLSRYPELNWCINEIANDFLHADIDGEYLHLKLKCPDSKFTNGEDTVLHEEFRNLVSLYDLKTTGFTMIRKFLIEGEVCFENVIDHNHPEYGIIGFKYVPTMFYDFLRNRMTGQIEGLYIDPERLKAYSQFSTYGGTSYAGQSSSVFNAVRQVPAFSYTYSLDMKNKIVMPFEQVTYFNSGVLSEDGSVVFPVIEDVAVPTRQLLLMNDAIVIYRITRAPEKLAFNIDLAGMPEKKAAARVREMAMAHKSRKAVQGSGAVTNVYNAETMLDAYYFWKTGEGSGTTVQSLAATSHYNEINDVEFFLKRILKFLHIPWQRWQESAANRQDKQSIQNEEYSFAQSEVHYQTLFAAAVKKTYITHLRMKGYFSKYDLHESEIDVEMNPPALFENYQAQTRFKDALDIVTSGASLEFLSKNLLLKKVFNFTDAEIKENEVEVRREALYKSQTEWMAEQLKAGKANANVYLDNEKYLDAQQGGDMSAQGAVGPDGQPVPGPEGQPPVPPPDGGGGGEGAAPQGGEAGGGEVPGQGDAGSSLDLGSEQMNAQADAGFQEFAGSGNIQQTTADELDLTDDSGKTQAERETQENPEYGDFGELAASKTPRAAKRYPETERGIRGLEGVDGRETMGDVFKDAFGVKGGKSGDDLASGGLHDVFNGAFGKKEAKEGGGAGGEGTLTDVFRDSFRETAKHGKNGGEDMEDVFRDAFGEGGGSGGGDSGRTLSDVFDDVFGKKSKESAKSVVDGGTMTGVFRDTFGRRHAGRYEKPRRKSLGKALDDMFGR